MRDAVNDAIDKLQKDPRPKGCEATDIDPDMFYCQVETTSPKYYTITYKVDEDNLRVLVYSIAETHFRHSQ